MNSMKKIIPSLAFVLLAGGSLYVSDAKAYGCPCGAGHDFGHNSRHGAHMMQENSNITDEQRQEARKLVEQAQEKMSLIKQQLFVKHEELKALQNAATPDVKAVSQKATEISQLEQSLATERKTLGEAIDKALGLEPGTHSFGRHGKGHGIGRGMGHGMGHGAPHERNHNMGRGHNM